MLRTLRSDDLTLRIPEENLRGAERELAEEINDLINDLRKKLLKQERHSGQLEALINTIDAALIVADDDGTIHFMNQKAVQGLCGFRIKNLSYLDTLHKGLYQSLHSLVPGQSKLVTINKDGKEAQLKISMVRYGVDGHDTLLFSIENVNQLMLQNEIEAQRKLVSVLTHEIMNSLSPIISLSETLYESVSIAEEDTRIALNAIKQRSTGLLSFVENYRKLARLSPPKYNWTKIGELFEDLRKLYSVPYIQYEIEDIDLEVRIDRQQIVQALINLVNNAVEACSANPVVIVAAKVNYPSRRFIISVLDNGNGISPEAKESIFIPFYTTKPNGSGIGLSLSRQMVIMHGGSLYLDSSDASGSKFIISLPCVYKT
ncbi:MAG: ATP-binding protein [Odoribacter sp.]|nr:ATP-binding protein [Odoribacter sp.]